MGRLQALLICAVVLSSAAIMANGTRPAGTLGATHASPVAAATPATAAGSVVRAPAPPPPATLATAGTKAPPEQQQSPLDSKRKVPNGPDPIHNRRARWGEAPSKRV